MWIETLKSLIFSLTITLAYVFADGRDPLLCWVVVCVGEIILHGHSNILRKLDQMKECDKKGKTP